MYKTIDLLQELEDYYYIDYIPYHPTDANYLELEEYFEENYLPEYAKKIVRIALKLIYFYECEIFLTENTKKVELKYNIPFNVNIRDNGPEKIAYIIEQVILKDFSSVQILFSTPLFLMSINGGFSVAIYQPSDKVIQILQSLVTQEGLFLKHTGDIEDN